MEPGHIGKLEILTSRAPFLSDEETLEIVNLQWLLDHAPQHARVRAVDRITILLERLDVDATDVVDKVREIASELQNAIEERIAELTLLSPQA